MNFFFEQAPSRASLSLLENFQAALRDGFGAGDGSGAGRSDVGLADRRRRFREMQADAD